MRVRVRQTTINLVRSAVINYAGRVSFFKRSIGIHRPEIVNRMPFVRFSVQALWWQTMRNDTSMFSHLHSHTCKYPQYTRRSTCMAHYIILLFVIISISLSGRKSRCFAIWIDQQAAADAAVSPALFSSWARAKCHNIFCLHMRPRPYMCATDCCECVFFHSIHARFEQSRSTIIKHNMHSSSVVVLLHERFERPQRPSQGCIPITLHSTIGQHSHSCAAK